MNKQVRSFSHNAMPISSQNTAETSWS